MDPEIIALRQQIAARPRPTDLAQRRRDIDARGLAFPLPTDVAVEELSAAGVPAEWTVTQAAGVTAAASERSASADAR